MNGILNIVRYATVISDRNEEEFLPTVSDSRKLTDYLLNFYAQ